MSDTQTRTVAIVPPRAAVAIATQRATLKASVEHLASLQEKLQARTDMRTTIAADPTTYGPHSNGQLEKADQELRNIQGQIAEAEQAVQTATRTLEHLERVQERQEKVGTSKTKPLAERIHALRTTLAGLDERGQQLVALLADDPDKEAIHDDIALNNEKRKAALERLELYEQAHAAAVRDDQANAQAGRTLEAFSNRDKVLSLAAQRVGVAEKIDNYLAGLAPLMREWREIDEAVAAAVSDTVRTLYAGADFQTRSRANEHLGGAAMRNSIAPAVAQALLLADVQDVTRDLLQFRYSSTIDAKRNPITAKEQAAKAVPGLAAVLDEVILKAGVQRG